MGQENLNKIYGHVKVVDGFAAGAIAAATTLSEFDSGKVIAVNQIGGTDYTITLPANPVAGWNVTLVLTATASDGNVTIATNTGQAMPSGIVVSTDGTVSGVVLTITDPVTNSTIKFVEGVAAAGDKIEILCTNDASTGGVGYHATGFCAT
ncbi:hypothetical protein OAT10_00065 [Luminiphilus sp.]|nr:hypothetical protein [Luminiphilus sp.]